MKFEAITREQFLATGAHPVHDKFARTFVAKADMAKLWPVALGAVEKGEVLAAICMRESKRQPLVANLQLLHTFYDHRRKGIARALVLREYQRMYELGVQYFRVSSEAESVEFYRSLGLKFWGKQKSGTLLCMHKVVSLAPADGVYQLDEVIRSAVDSGRRGGVVRKFTVPR